MTGETLPGAVLVGLAEVVVLCTMLATGLARPGQRHAALIAGGLPLALLPPAVAATYASSNFLGLVAREFEQGILASFASLWILQRVAWGAFAGSCLIGLLLNAWRFDGAADARNCSARRGVVLLLLPVLGLAVASLSTQPLYKALRVSTAVISTDLDDPNASYERAKSVLEAEGLTTTKSSGAIARVSSFIGGAATIGYYAGATTILVLLGLALPGFILGWRIRFGAAFSVTAYVAWLLAAVGAMAVSFGVADPLRLE